MKYDTVKKKNNLKFKTVFISDTHLGSRGASAEQLIEFLKTVEFETLILNGDILDGWRLSSKWFFPQRHVNVIRKILSLSKEGKEIIYIPGNHDEFLRKFHTFELALGNISVVSKYEHHGVDGKVYLTVHGDAFDNLMKYHKWVAKIGDIGYNFLIQLNFYVNKIRHFLKRPYWSISKAIKGQVKEAANFIFAFEDTAAKAAVDRYDGIICGHIHHPSIKVIDDSVVYMNSGDWVETCSWVGERYDGVFETWEWNNGSPIMLESTENLEFK